MMEEVSGKPKKILDDIDNEDIFNKSVRTSTTKPKVISIETIKKPSEIKIPVHKEAVLFKEKTLLKEKPLISKKVALQTFPKDDLEAENFNFDDEFNGDDFTSVDNSTNSSVPVSDKTSVTQANDMNTPDSKDLNDYIGDVSIQNHTFSIK